MLILLINSQGFYTLKSNKNYGLLAFTEIKKTSAFLKINMISDQKNFPLNKIGIAYLVLSSLFKHFMRFN